MLSGSTADRLGRKRIFLLGLVLFTIGSLLCSVAPGLGWLIAFRMLQAVGGSMLNPVAMSIIQRVHRPAGAGPGHRDLGRRRRTQPRARTDRRRTAGRLDRLAVDLLGQCA